jgi:hypothetical protein
MLRLGLAGWAKALPANDSSTANGYLTLIEALGRRKARQFTLRPPAGKNFADLSL